MGGEGRGREHLILGNTGKTPFCSLLFPIWNQETANPKVKLCCPDSVMLVGFAQAAV